MHSPRSSRNKKDKEWQFGKISEPSKYPPAVMINVESFEDIKRKLINWLLKEKRHYSQPDAYYKNVFVKAGLLEDQEKLTLRKAKKLLKEYFNNDVTGHGKWFLRHLQDHGNPKVKRPQYIKSILANVHANVQEKEWNEMYKQLELERLKRGDWDKYIEKILFR